MCYRTDDSTGVSVLLLHRNADFVPSAYLPAYDAPEREVREFFVTIMLERRVPLNTARDIASHWLGNGLMLHLQNIETYHCWFNDKNSRILHADVHAIMRRESKQRQRQRDVQRRRKNLAKAFCILRFWAVYVVSALFVTCFTLPASMSWKFKVIETPVWSFLMILPTLLAMNEDTFGCDLAEPPKATSAVSSGKNVEKSPV